MAETTGIKWATHTASPWFGCTEVSPGCAHCYARELTLQHKWAGWGDSSPRVPSKGFWRDAYKWNRRAAGANQRPRVFTSLMDWLDPKVPIEWLAEFLKVIYETPHLDWLLLTKRPELYADRMRSVLTHFAEVGGHDTADWLIDWRDGESPTNVWVGVTCEDRKRADERIPILWRIPARVRWVSVEPLLETFQIDVKLLDWAVIGGESGPKRRDCGVGAIISIADQCKWAGVPVFVKQDCALRPGQQGRIPDDIWALKEFPNANHF